LFSYIVLFHLESHQTIFTPRSSAMSFIGKKVIFRQRNGNGEVALCLIGCLVGAILGMLISTFMGKKDPPTNLVVHTSKVQVFPVGSNGDKFLILGAPSLFVNAIEELEKKGKFRVTSLYTIVDKGNTTSLIVSVEEWRLQNLPATTLPSSSK
jgi:hypothetical protein